MAVPAELEPILAELASMPAHLESAASGFDDRRASAPGPEGSFSLVEHAWHLADLEREGYGERIRRLLGEADPRLADFDGARIAAERNYRRKSLAEGVAAFAAARAANLRALRAVPTDAWDRAGEQEGVGRVALRDVPRMMQEHDRSHRGEIAALLAGATPPRPTWT
jgi:DinB family protein